MGYIIVLKKIFTINKKKVYVLKHLVTKFKFKGNNQHKSEHKHLSIFRLEKPGRIETQTNIATSFINIKCYHLYR